MLKADILPGYRTDHSFIVLILDPVEFTKGNSYWKFNNSFLKDHYYISEINNLIEYVRHRYTSEIQASDANQELISDSDIILNINYVLFFETVLVEIRGKSIAYS